MARCVWCNGMLNSPTATYHGRCLQILARRLRREEEKRRFREEPNKEFSPEFEEALEEV